MGVRGLRRAGVRLVALALMVPAPGALAATLNFGGEFATAYDSNLGNAGSPDDRRGAASVYLGTGVDWEQRYGLYTALQVHTGVAAEQLLKLEQLSNVRASARLRVLHKPGMSFHTPILGAWISAGARDYDSDLRDSFDYRAGVSAAAPVTTLVQARFDVSAWRRESSSRVFDQSGTSVALSLDWHAAPRLVAYGSLRLDDGDFVVTAQGEGVVTPKTEHLYLQPRARAIEADPSFGSDWWAFAVDSRTLIAAAGVNVPLSDSMALDLQIQRGEASMGGFSYVRDVGSLGLLVRW